MPSLTGQSRNYVMSAHVISKSLNLVALRARPCQPARDELHSTLVPRYSFAFSTI